VLDRVEGRLQDEALAMIRVIGALRSWVAERLGLKAHQARDGTWWEIDLLIVFLIGCALLACARVLS